MFYFLFLNYVIVHDSLKMCYVYIHTCNHNESLINKIKSKSDHFEKDAERDRSRQRDMSNLKTYPIILL